MKNRFLDKKREYLGLRRKSKARYSSLKVILLRLEEKVNFFSLENTLKSKSANRLSFNKRSSEMSAALRIEDCFNTTPVQKEELDYTGGRSLDAVWVNQNLDVIQKLILQFLASKCNFNNKFNDNIKISVKEIQYTIGTSEQTTIKHLKCLRESGYITVTETSHKTRLYCLTDKIFDEYDGYLTSKGYSSKEAESKRFYGGRSLYAIWDLKLKALPKAFLSWLGSKADFRKPFINPYMYAYSYICRELNLKEDAIIGLVKDLENKGLIKVKRTRNRPNIYSLSPSIFNNTSGYSNNDPKSQTPNNDPKLQTLRRPNDPKSQTPNDPKWQTHSPCTISYNNPLYARVRAEDKNEELQRQSNSNFREVLGIVNLIKGTGLTGQFVCYDQTKGEAKILLDTFGLEVLKNLKKQCYLHECYGINFKTINQFCKKIQNGEEIFKTKKSIEKIEPKLEEPSIPMILTLIQNQEVSNDVEPSNEERKIKFLESMKSIFVGYDNDFLSNVNRFINEIKPVQLSFFQREYERMSSKKFNEFFGKIIKKQYENELL